MPDSRQEAYRAALRTKDPVRFRQNALALRRYLLQKDCSYPKYLFTAPEGRRVMFGWVTGPPE